MAGIKEITVDSGGSSYESVPTVAIRSHYVTHIDVEDGGEGYLEGAHTHGTARQYENSLGADNIRLQAEASASNDFYNQAALYITEGTNKGFYSLIEDYDGPNRIVTTYDSFTTPCDATTKYEIGPNIVPSRSAAPDVDAVPFGFVRGGVIQSVVITNDNYGYAGSVITSISTFSESTGTPGKVDGSTRNIPTKSAVLIPYMSRGSGASAVAKLTGTGIASVAVDNSPTPNSAGTPTAPKYTATPTITVTPTNGDEPTTAAILTGVLTGTSIARLIITNAGTGYGSAPTVSITGGGGSSGAATVTVSGGSINSVSGLTAGSGYTSTPTVTFSGGGGTGAAGQVVLTPQTLASVTVTNAGAGYTAVPTVTCFPSDTFGDLNGQLPAPNTFVASNAVSAIGAPGMAAILTPTMTSTTVESIKMTAFGAGYTVAPTVVISGGGGSGATASSKLNGYNKNTTNEHIRTPISAFNNATPMNALVTKRSPPDRPVDTIGSYSASGGRVPQKLKVGQLAMMKGGLYRVTGVEGFSFGQPIGLQGSVTALSGTTAEIALDEPDENLDAITIPGGTKIIFGEDLIREVGTMNASNVTLSGGVGTFTLAGALSREADLGVGTEVRIQFIPGNSGTNTNFLLDEFTIDGLDTLSVGDNEVVYHLGFGLNYTPKYIAADGTFAKAGRGFAEATVTPNTEVASSYNLDLGGSSSDRSGRLVDQSTHQVAGETSAAAANGKGRTVGGATKTLVGYTSTRVRVYQPKGVPKFAATATNFKDDTSTVVGENGLLKNDGLMINPTGFISANESPAQAPNPTYMLWIGSGEENLPQFQAAANDEDIIDPRITFVGHKYSLRPVPEDEVRRMQKRSGGFKYEVIPYALDAYESESLGRGNAGPAGPREGWSVHVDNHRGTPMNKAEYDNATNQATPMTNNMLNGASSRRNNRRRDPRSAHRRDY